MTSVIKLIVSNTAAQLTAKFFAAGLTLLTTYYIIRLGGLGLYGDLTKILVLVAVGFTAIDFGLNAEVVRSGTTESKLKDAVSRALIARVALSLIAVIVLNILINFLPGGYGGVVKSVFSFGSLAIIFQGLYTSGNAYFQSKLSYWKSAISVITGSLVGTLLTFYFLYTNASLFGLVFANTLGYLVMAVSSLTFLPRSLLNPSAYNLKTILPTLKSSIYLGLILFASVLASKIDTIILGVFQSSSQVGQYGLAYRIFEVVLTLPTFAMNALFPLMVKGTPKLLKKALITLGALGIIAGVTLYFAAPLITFVKPGELSGTISSLRILSLTLPFFYTTSPLMWHLLTRRQDKVVLVVYLLAAAINTSLNVYFVPSYGIIASAISTGITEAFIFFFLLYFSLKHLLKIKN